MSPQSLHLLTLAVAIAGAALALGAALARAFGRLSPARVALVYRLAYGLLGLSVALFILRGFMEQPR